MQLRWQVTVPWILAVGSFTSAARQVSSSPAFGAAAVVVPDNLRLVSRLALDIFASTHNFFALHLVTGAHAYRLLYPFAGEERDAIFTLGILCGYAAVGAPVFVHHDSPEFSGPVSWLNLIRDDEHDAKLAYSADDQSRHWGDPAYRRIAADYLDSR